MLYLLRLLTMLLAISTSIFPLEITPAESIELVGTRGAREIRLSLSMAGRHVGGHGAIEGDDAQLSLDGSLAGTRLSLRAFANGVKVGEIHGIRLARGGIAGYWQDPLERAFEPLVVQPPGETWRPRTVRSVSGRYQAVNSTATRVLDVLLMPEGYALVVGSGFEGAKAGRVRSIVRLEGGRARLSDITFDDADREYGCAMTITFSPNELLVSRDNGNCAEPGASYDGRYKRIGPARFE